MQNLGNRKDEKYLNQYVILMFIESNIETRRNNNIFQVLWDFFLSYIMKRDLYFVEKASTYT